jgi:hypothetical protein
MLNQRCWTSRCLCDFEMRLRRSVDRFIDRSIPRCSEFTCRVLHDPHHVTHQLILAGPGPLARSKAFEADLAFFLGPDWRVSFGEGRSMEGQGGKG